MTPVPTTVIRHPKERIAKCSLRFLHDRPEMTFLRGSLDFQPMVWIKMGTDTMLAMLAAPLIFLLLYSLASLSSYEIKYEGLRYRFDGR